MLFLFVRGIYQQSTWPKFPSAAGAQDNWLLQECKAEHARLCPTYRCRCYCKVALPILIAFAFFSIPEKFERKKLHSSLLYTMRLPYCTKFLQVSSESKQIYKGFQVKNDDVHFVLLKSFWLSPLTGVEWCSDAGCLMYIWVQFHTPWPTAFWLTKSDKGRSTQKQKTKSSIRFGSKTLLHFLFLCRSDTEQAWPCFAHDSECHHQVMCHL
jgi:hypothetical protein